MGFWSDTWKSIKDTASDIWSDVKDGNILGAIGGIVELGFDISTGGLYSAGKTAVSSLLDISVPSPNTEYKDRKVMSRGASNPRQVMYGGTRVGCQVVFMESSGADDEYFHLICVFTAHKCETMPNIFFNEDLAVLEGTVVNKFVGFLDVSINLGDQTAADSTAVSLAPTWTSNDKLLGQTYVYLRLKYDDEVYQSGIPTVTARIQGKSDIYDPRTTTTGYTTNHALCILDYLRWDQGMNVPDSAIDMQSFIDAANVSDEQVPFNTTGNLGNRYTINGTLRLNAAPIDNITSMLESGHSSLTFAQGVWSIVSGTYTAPVMSFDEDDLNGPLRFAPGSGKGARINVGKGTFISPTHNYEPTDFVQIAVSGYVESDLQELPTSFNYPFTNRDSMARRLAKISIERSRFGLGVEVLMKYRALELTVGDRINLSIERLGWVDKIFRVEAIGFGVDQGVALSLREDSPEIYDWDETESLNVEVPPSVNLPDPFTVEPPAIDSVTEELYFTNVPSEIKTRLTLGWTAGVSAVAYDVQYNFNGVGWVEAFSNFGGNPVQLNDFEVGSSQFRVRAINGIGVRSAWSTVYDYDVLGKTAPPPDVEKMYISGGILNWEYFNAPLDLAGFKVRYHSGDRQTWGDAVELHQGLVSNTTFNILDLVFGVKTFLVKAVDTTGNESVNPAFVIFGLGDPVLDNIFRTISYFGLGFPGTITNGSIDGDGYIQADQLGGFYSPDPNSIFYIQGFPNSSFYGTPEYETLTYDFSFTPDSSDLPASLTLNTTIVGANPRIELDYQDNGVYAAFNGIINDIELKAYNFRIVIPGQFAATAPQIEEVEVVVDVPDIREVLNDIAISSAGTRLPITKTYRSIEAVTLTLQDDATTATSVKQVDKDPTLGPLIKIYNDSGVAVSGNIDATIGGY